MSNSDSSTQLGIFEAAQEAEQADSEDDLPAESDTDIDTDTDTESSADRPIPTPRHSDDSTASDGTELVNMAEHGRSGVRRIDRSSRFGNPFELEKDGGDYTRAESIDEYRKWLASKLTDDEFREAVEDLRGDTLGCWCKPKACHGDVILEYLQGDWNPIDEHYRQDGISDVYESLGVIDDDGGYSIGNHDFGGWYQDKNNKARPWILAKKWDSLRRKVDRTLYATISYAPGEWHMDSWAAFEWDGQSHDWIHERPMPDYSEISAIAPFADIDLADDVKEDRPDGDIPQEMIEAALSHYIDAFAELAGSREHVYGLDSVGGAYIFIAPSSTKPIAKEFPADERELIFDDMMDKLNVWLNDVRDDVISAIPETKGTFAPDKLNNKNRLFKAPLSVHTSLDGVVTPIDVAEPSYDYTPLTAVDSDLIDDTTRWAEDFTGDHTAALDAIVTSLYPNAADGADSWKDALATVVRDLEEEQEANSEPEDHPPASQRTNPAEVNKTKNKQVVFDAIREINAKYLVQDLCDEWDVGGRNPPRFNPGYRSCSSRDACFVNDEGKIIDLDDEIKAFDVVTYAAREQRIIGDEDTATGSDWWEAVDELRKLGYHIPRYVGDDDISDYYAYPIDQTARANDYGEPFEDNIALLRTCLKLRDDHPELDDTTPPYAALVAIADIFSLLMADDNEGILGDSGYRYAREIYTELTLDNLADELGD